MFVLYKTSTDAFLELLGASRSLEDAVVELIDVVERLPQKARNIWDQCEYRRFNVGLQSGKEPHDKLFLISNQSIAKLAGIGAEIAITVYAPHKDGEAAAQTKTPPFTAGSSREE